MDKATIIAALREHEAEQLKEEERVQQECKDDKMSVADKPAAGSEKPSQAQASGQKAGTSGPKLSSLSPADMDTVAAIGKTLGHLIKSEAMVSLPTIALNTITPSLTPPSLGMARSMALAA